MGTTLASFHARGTARCLIDILNKCVHNGVHNSGYYFKNLDGQPSGLQVLEFLASLRTRSNLLRDKHRHFHIDGSTQRLGRANSGK